MSQEKRQDRPCQSAVDEKLLSLLVCPACRQPVEQRADLLVCRGCGLGYPIKNGIPVMLVSEAITPERYQSSPSTRTSGGPGEEAGKL